MNKERDKKGKVELEKNESKVKKNQLNFVVVG